MKKIVYFNLIEMGKKYVYQNNMEQIVMIFVYYVSHVQDKMLKLKHKKRKRNIEDKKKYKQK